MKKSQKITLSAMLAALAVVIMLAAYFPYLTIAVPALAGIAVMLALAEAGAAYALAAYVVSGVLAFLLCEKEAAALYICLFGYYPLLKAYIEKIKPRFLEWAVKILLFNAAAALSYFCATRLFGISADDFGTLGKWGAGIFLFLCNIAFVFYDFCLSALAAEYFKKYRPRLQKIFKFLKK